MNTVFEGLLVNTKERPKKRILWGPCLFRDQVLQTLVTHVNLARAAGMFQRKIACFIL